MITLAAVACSLLVPTIAMAATPPTLDTPATAASGFAEGQSMTFTWHGNLQGDADAVARSFFRLEIAKAADVPAGAQAEWNSLEVFEQTDPGTAIGSLAVGVPSSGSYKWRVCAWGVLDDIAANEIQQLPGGCSAARSFTTSAATASKPAPGEIAQTTTRTEVGAPTIINKVRESKPSPVAPVDSVDPVEVIEEIGPAVFTHVTRITHGLGKTPSAVEGLGPKTIRTDAAAEQKRGFGSAIASGLGTTLPLIPIPFWTLALLLACFPVAKLWRRNVLSMFDWADGSINGNGAYDDMLGNLAPIQQGSLVKDSSTTADSEATAPPRPVSDRRRTAA